LRYAASAGEPSFDQKWVPLPSLGGENTAYETVPGPASGVVSRVETSASADAGPMRPSEGASKAGRVFQVIVPSDQALSVTACTSPPSPSDDGAVLLRMNRRVLVILPSIGGTANLRYAVVPSFSTARSVMSGKTTSGQPGPAATSSSTGTVTLIMSPGVASQHTSIVAGGGVRRSARCCRRPARRKMRRLISLTALASGLPPTASNFWSPHWSE
jgi:hypothetical protein